MIYKSHLDMLNAVCAKLRQEQDEVERQLWEERQAMFEAQEEKVKVAVTK